MSIIVRLMGFEDWPAVKAIYQAGIDTGNATFTSQSPASWEEWCQGKVNECSLVASEAGQVVGWAVISKISERCVFQGVAEVSIYIDPNSRNKGVGSILLQALFEKTEAAGFWTLQAGIFPENEASLKLHLKNGFRQIGIREKIGLMTFGPYKDQWRDIVFMERRSQKVGITTIATE